MIHRKNIIHVSRGGEPRINGNCADYRALYKAAAWYIKHGRSLREFVAAMGKHGCADEPIYTAYIRANGGEP